MSDFKAKMHQIRFRVRLRPRPQHPAGGAYSAPPGPLAGFEGPTTKGGKGRGGKMEWMRGEGMEEKGGEGKGRGEGRRG